MVELTSEQQALIVTVSVLVILMIAKELVKLMKRLKTSSCWGCKTELRTPRVDNNGARVDIVTDQLANQIVEQIMKAEV